MGLASFIIPANAASFSLSGQITVTGIVPPAKYVYVDNQFAIKKVVSNTDIDAAPVFLTNTSPPRTVSATPLLLQAYENLKQQFNFLRHGVVYDSLNNSATTSMVASGVQQSLAPTALNQSAALTVDNRPTESLLSLAT